MSEQTHLTTSNSTIPRHLVLELADLGHDLVAFFDPLLNRGPLGCILEGLSLQYEEMARVVQLVDDARNDYGPSTNDRIVSCRKFSTG